MRRAELEQEGARLSRGLSDQQRRMETISEEKTAAVAPVQDRMLERLSNRPSTEVKEQPIPEFERPRVDGKEMQETFGMMMAASMLTGLASRTPFYGAMNAMTGMLQGYMAQDEKVVREALQVFDRNVKVIESRNQQKRAEVDRALRQYGNDLQALQQEFQLIAAKHDDQMALEAARSKSISEAQKVIEQNIRAVDSTIERLHRDRAAAEGRAAQIEESKARRAEASARAAEAASHRAQMLDLARQREGRHERESAAKIAKWQQDATAKAERALGGDLKLSAGEREDVVGRHTVLNMIDDLIARQRLAIQEGRGYGGYMMDNAGNLILKAKRATGDQSAQNEIDFFSDMETIAQPARHALFGAAIEKSSQGLWYMTLVVAGEALPDLPDETIIIPDYKVW
jgi:hypothetical protein